MSGIASCVGGQSGKMNFWITRFRPIFEFHAPRLRANQCSANNNAATPNKTTRKKLRPKKFINLFIDHSQIKLGRLDLPSSVFLSFTGEEINLCARLHSYKRRDLPTWNRLAFLFNEPFREAGFEVSPDSLL
jgi:hypothetical protein